MGRLLKNQTVLVGFQASCALRARAVVDALV